MNSNILIFCLFIGANIGYSVVGYYFDVDRVEVDGNLDNSERWEKETNNLIPGLKSEDGPTGRTLDIPSILLAPLNASINRNHIKFLLFTRKNPIIPVIMTFDNALEKLQKHYLKGLPTIFVAHGFLNTGYMTACREIQDAALKKANMNVIVVDWSAIALNYRYHEVAAKVPTVGLALSIFMKFMKGEGFMSFDSTVLAGHSLGAHVVGIAGYLSNDTFAHRPLAIYGLDPALPLFKFAKRANRISADSAQHVQIIHTNPGFLGTDAMWGHQSFFMSGIDGYQTGCRERFGICAHDRAFYYYAESINSSKGFYGRECTDYAMFQTGKCTGKKTGRMGGIVPDAGMGYYELYTVEVNPSQPYAKGITWEQECKECVSSVRGRDFLSVFLTEGIGG